MRTLRPVTLVVNCLRADRANLGLGHLPARAHFPGCLGFSHPAGVLRESRSTGHGLLTCLVVQSGLQHKPDLHALIAATNSATIRKSSQALSGTGDGRICPVCRREGDPLCRHSPSSAAPFSEKYRFMGRPASRGIRTCWASTIFAGPVPVGWRKTTKSPSAFQSLGIVDVSRREFSGSRRFRRAGLPRLSN
jgi:hypothetical protein